MLAASTTTPQVVDIALLVAGVVVVAVVALRLLDSGRWRNPLAGAVLPEQGPTLIHVMVVFAAFALLQQLSLAIVLGTAQTPESPEPGSVLWHQRQAAGLLSHVATIVVMIVVLVLTRGRRRTGPRVDKGLLIGLLTVLGLVPVMTVQHQAGYVVWTWLNPATPPPTHVVLQALSCSEWGRWGVAQLLFSAIVTAPLAEELFFRGILLGACVQHLRRGWPAIVLSGMAFGAVHVVQPQDVLPLATMGLVLGYVRLRWGALWPCVATHMLFNARTMLFALLAPEFA